MDLAPFGIELFNENSDFYILHLMTLQLQLYNYDYTVIQQVHSQQNRAMIVDLYREPLREKHN